MKRRTSTFAVPSGSTLRSHSTIRFASAVGTRANPIVSRSASSQAW